MAESDGQEKTEEATGKRLDDSREKGQTAKSQEINSVAVFGTGMLILYFIKNSFGNQMNRFSVEIFSNLDTMDLNMDMFMEYFTNWTEFFLVIQAPVFVGLILISIASGYGQVGFRITPKAIAPKFSKFDPIKGLKNKMFSSHSFAELLKSVAKLVIIGLFTYWVLEDIIISSIGLVDFSVPQIVDYMIETALSLVWQIMLVYVVIAAADFAWQKLKHKKDLMMTKQEVKEEMKDTEGDPLIKSQIKGKQMAMARKRMMKDVPKADVVITNPTHFAVALKYEMGKDKAPVVVAKGMDFLAQKIKEVARENNVHIYEDVHLARSLYKMCEVGDEVPEDLFVAVAQILAYVFQLRNKPKTTIV